MTTPTAPISLTGADASGFQDALASRAYVLAGPGTLQTPQALAHTPVNLTTGGAQAIYIAPLQFHAALQPLLVLRQVQPQWMDTLAREEKQRNTGSILADMSPADGGLFPLYKRHMVVWVEKRQRYWVTLPQKLLSAVGVTDMR